MLKIIYFCLLVSSINVFSQAKPISLEKVFQRELAVKEMQQKITNASCRTNPFKDNKDTMHKYNFPYVNSVNPIYIFSTSCGSKYYIDHYGRKVMIKNCDRKH